jgi:hypothetical protein
MSSCLPFVHSRGWHQGKYHVVGKATVISFILHTYAVMLRGSAEAYGCIHQHHPFSHGPFLFFSYALFSPTQIFSFLPEPIIACVSFPPFNHRTGQKQTVMYVPSQLKLDRAKAYTFPYLYLHPPPGRLVYMDLAAKKIKSKSFENIRSGSQPNQPQPCPTSCSLFSSPPDQIRTERTRER